MQRNKKMWPIVNSKLSQQDLAHVLPVLSLMFLKAKEKKYNFV